ncbi:Adenylate-forming reductase [Zalerion maritima]|uniref:Adenylate-forming reductase n=1 Tax=Zalerion maritima TaxID=339359 RepID=A0AAD5RN08_9PEZI|nr:Adenylate-forming reductase [Zalerion maritima]
MMDIIMHSYTINLWGRSPTKMSSIKDADLIKIHKPESSHIFSWTQQLLLCLPYLQQLLAMAFEQTSALEMGLTISRVPGSFTNGPQITSPFPTITAAFNHWAKTRPDLLAAKDLSGASRREISYAELARRARSLSSQLMELGVRPGDRVPLVVKRGIEMLVGILAILSCGAQYVPLDGSVVPDSTLNFVLDQAGSRFVLCIKATEHRLQNMAKPCLPIIIDNDAEGYVVSREVPLLQDLASTESGCYVIYTSGTTGTPKGVDVTHKNVTNLVCLSPGNLGISPGTNVGSILNISFDMAAWEVLGTLCNGGTLILRGSEWGEALQLMNVIICTPSILAKYDPAKYPNIRVAATAGEPSSQKLADTWATHGAYYNCCGPTETTIVNTMQKHISGTPLSIGRPTPNNTVYLLDENENPIPIGDPGVMWAGGHGISRGYVGLPEKTAEKYRLDKFASDGSMMYNTGDLCKWKEDGLIEILGRQDDQIKIKGFRVELDGVTTSINSFPGVTRACALFFDGEIYGFFAPATTDVNALKEHMKKKQPYYAIPTKFHGMEALPTTANGKIDKRALKPGTTLSIPQMLVNYAASEAGHSDMPPSSVVTPTASLVGEKNGVEHAEDGIDLGADIPGKKLPQPFRGLVYRVFIVYRTLFTAIGVANIAALISVFVLGINREWLNTLVAINLVIAILIRQDFVINLLYTVCCSIPKSWPLGIRKQFAKVYHLGGVHSSAALCAGAWLLVSNVSNIICGLAGWQGNSAICSNYTPQSIASRVVSWILTALFIAMFTIAWPSIRKNYHDLFERTHRFVGWTMLALFWVQVMLGIEDFRRTHNHGKGLGATVIMTPSFWLLIAATLSITISWLSLRKVRVDSEVLSSLAIRLHFDYTVPVNGSFVRLSKRPFLEWHSFATIPAPYSTNDRPAGHSVVVSNAGDWTRNLIEHPPTWLYTRGVPTCGVMRIATLFNNIVVVATGSGIGPCLGHIQNPSCETSVIWSTPRPELNFGRPIIDSITEKVPDAVIHDTKVLGRPDLVKMAFNMAAQKGAEVVIIIANEKITKKVVYGLETRGVPAYGAIWDS